MLAGCPSGALHGLTAARSHHEYARAVKERHAGRHLPALKRGRGMPQDGHVVGVLEVGVPKHPGVPVAAAQGMTRRARVQSQHAPPPARKRIQCGGAHRAQSHHDHIVGSIGIKGFGRHGGAPGTPPVYRMPPAIWTRRLWTTPPPPVQAARSGRHEGEGSRHVAVGHTHLAIDQRAGRRRVVVAHHQHRIATTMGLGDGFGHPGRSLASEAAPYTPPLTSERLGGSLTRSHWRRA